MRDRRVVVTGATGGLGWEVSLALAQAGAQVVLTGRNREKGIGAVERICAAVPQARVSFEMLDLSSLASVCDFAAALEAVDVLINNAGVMALPTRQTTTDGFEMQLGVNYLGHFALTQLLLPQLKKSSLPRVINVSSLAHWRGRIRFEDLQSEASYRPWKAYAQSKLAMLLFTFELQRRSEQTGLGLLSVATHPGWAQTDLVANGPGAASWLGRAARLWGWLFCQSAAQGALSTLWAASSPRVRSGEYYGPQGIFELKGPVGPAGIAHHGRDAEIAQRLWDISMDLTFG